MDMIDDMETACQLLKEGEILCIREGERVLFFGLRNERVQVMSAQAHYVLDLCAFAEPASSSRCGREEAKKRSVRKKMQNIIAGHINDRSCW